jgi:hypothetical protein
LTLEGGFSSLAISHLRIGFVDYLHPGGSKMGHRSDSAISRREFARRAALMSAAASIAPAHLLPSAPFNDLRPAQQPPTAAKLSPQSQAEVDSRIQAILSQYGARLSDAQKTDIRRLATEAQAPLDRLRAFPTTNGDGTGLYLKPLIEREKKFSPRPAVPNPTAAPKNS